MTISTLYPLSPAQITAYHRDGFVMVPGLFAPDEIAPVQEACRADPNLGGRVVHVTDSDGGQQDLAGWSGDDGDDLLGLMTRIARIVDGAQALIGEPIYHWHSKFSMKKPGSGGRWDWHQDFGSWYVEGCLRPAMTTCTVAVDPCDEDNGCMQLVKGSHLFGRLDHVAVGAARGADPKRVERAREQYETVSCIMAPGDGLFFHANTLHASGPNHSQRPRSLLHFSYNAITNDPVETTIPGHRYTPLTKAPDGAIRDGAWNGVIAATEFFAPSDDHPYGYTIRRAS